MENSCDLYDCIYNEDGECMIKYAPVKELYACACLDDEYDFMSEE